MVQLFKSQSCQHIETSQLICRAGAYTHPTEPSSMLQHQKKSRTPGAKGPELSRASILIAGFMVVYSILQTIRTLSVWLEIMPGYATVRDCKSFSRSTQKSTKKYI